MNQIPPLLILPLGLLLFVFFWCGLLIMIGRISGWIALAQRYRSFEPFTGARWRMQSAQFRWNSNYSGALTVGADARGLFLAMLLPFRPGHPALFIPWEQTKISMKQSRWQGRCMEIQFPEVPGTLVRFSEELAKRIAAAGPHLTQQSPLE